MSEGACRACRLRSSLLAELSPVLDLRARDRSRLVELLEREDEELIGLLGGRRREALGHAHGDGRLADSCARAAAICVHERLFPRRLRDRSAPRLLYTQGDHGALRQVDRCPSVAVLGTGRPSDYGVEMAHALSYSLARCGVVVVTLKADGIAWAARCGAERAGHGAVLLSGDGLEVAGAVDAQAVRGPARPRSCLAAELPPGSSGRGWGRLAAERTAVQLSDLVLVVEAWSVRELFGVEFARDRGVGIAAVPGRVTARTAEGPLELLADGAALARGAEDVLELVGGPQRPPREPLRVAGLPACLAEVLDRVSCGQETHEQLLSGGNPGRTLLALAQLELMGHVRRTRDGRYLAAAGGVGVGRTT